MQNKAMKREPLKSQDLNLQFWGGGPITAVVICPKLACWGS